FLEQHELRPGYDVVIVGGGVNGLSLAYHLAEVHGIRDVAVLERSYLGSGASGRNTQVLRGHYKPTGPRPPRPRPPLSWPGRIGPQPPGAPRQLQHARDRPPVRGEPAYVPDALPGA